MKAKGCIYILTNPSFPDYVKIGYASNLEKRLKQLNRAETIPFAFRAYAIYEVDKELTDKNLHELIDALNPDLRAIETFDGKKRTKEFYAMSPEDAYLLIDCIAKISGTEDRLKRVDPEGHQVMDEQVANEVEEIARRGPFRFSSCNIKPGAELTFKGDETIKAKVVDDRHIEYNGETTSLSALANVLCTKMGLKDTARQGTIWFTYEGKTLDDIRSEMEKDK